MTQGEVIDGKPVSGRGVKVSITRSKGAESSGPYHYTVRIQPGDPWEHGTASGRTVWIEGHGISQIIISLPVDTAEITNTRVLIIGKTREQTMRELQAIMTEGFKGYAEEQIRQAADKAKDIVFGIPTSYIELEEPFELSPRDGLIILKCDFEGANVSQRFDKIEEVVVSFDLTYKKPSKHYIVITPDIRATGNLVDTSLPLRGSIGGYYLIEYRQEFILTHSGDFESRQNSEGHPYFPLTVGNKWTYDTRVQMVVPGFMENPPKEGSTTFAVADKKRVSDKDCVVIREGMNESYYYIEDGCVMLAGSRGWASIEEFLSQQGLKIKFPTKYLENSLTTGKSWIREHIIGSHPDASLVSRVLCVETVTVPAGTFQDAIKIKNRLSVGSMGEVVVIEWLVKGVGRVKGSMLSRLGGNNSGAMPVQVKMEYELSSYDIAMGDHKRNSEEKDKQQHKEKKIGCSFTDELSPGGVG